MSPSFMKSNLKGYLAVAILLENRDEYAEAVIQCIKQDLDDMNETTNCLALQAVSNICSRQMAASFSEQAYKMLVSELSSL